MDIRRLIQKSRTSGKVKLPKRTLWFSAAVISFFAGGPALFDLFVFNKTLILKGEFWRILTGHFVHMNIDHLIWDLLAFIVLGSVIELKGKHLISSFVACCLAVSAWMFLGEPELLSYYGLSGALNGWLVMASLTLWEQAKEKKYLMVLVIALVKSGYEVLSNKPLFIDPQTSTVPSSHVAGLLGGVACWMYIKFQSARMLLPRVLVINNKPSR